MNKFFEISESKGVAIILISKDDCFLMKLHKFTF